MVQARKMKKNLLFKSLSEDHKLPRFEVIITII